jgi:GR25 family glycosyltransferase involved in LPS biosynthesis
MVRFTRKHKMPPPPKTLVLNLSHRTDRWSDIEKEFKDWYTPIEKVSAIQYSPGWKGCSSSHRKAVEIAKERNYPWVLIVEDDCLLLEDACERFQSLLPYLWKHRDDWDIFLGGLSHFTKKSSIVSSNPPIFKVKGYAAQFCLIHSKTYNRILRDIPADPEKVTKPKIIDVYYANRLRLWTTVPYLSVQQPSHSNILVRETNYTNNFKRAEIELEKILMKQKN